MFLLVNLSVVGLSYVRVSATINAGLLLYFATNPGDLGHGLESMAREELGYLTGL